MKKKLLAMLLAAVLAVSLLPGMAFAADTSGKCGDNLTWTYSNGTLTIQGTGPMKNYGWDSLLERPWLAYLEEIHTIIIDNGVTTIGEFAFMDCHSLTSLTIPGSVTSVGESAFRYCHGLTSVTIPDGIISIGERAFSECHSLTSVTILDSVTTIGAGAFSYCSNLTSVTIPDSVTTIGKSAFDYCGSLDIYYGGSESQWKQIFSDDDYEFPLNDVHYNSDPGETEPAPTEPENPGTPTFTDVPEGVWYYEAVQWAADRGYIQGYNGEFSPNGSLTRGAIFTILARVDNVNTEGGSTWYEKGMNWAVENGVSDGTSPTSDITLEMLVTMLYRYENKPDADTSVLARFSDSSSIHTWTDCREAMAWAVEIGLVQGGSDGKLGNH